MNIKWNGNESRTVVAGDPEPGNLAAENLNAAKAAESVTPMLVGEL